MAFDIGAELDLSEGDKLELFEMDGTICIKPVTVYPKRYIDELKSEIDATKEKIASGEQSVFDSVDTLLATLEET